jgi:HEPN domain-containing protein
LGTDKITYWLKIADYDLETAKAMLNSSRYLYVGFMCHQAIEKAFKAVISRDCAEGEFPPKIHDLLKLATRANLFDVLTEEQKDFIDSLNPLNVEARYPEYKDEIAAGLTRENTGIILSKTEEFLCWIKQQL